MALVIFIALLPIHYQHNDAYIDLYNNNAELFNKYINSIDIEQNEGNVDVPDYLKDIYVDEIEIDNSYVYFWVKYDTPYYGGIYYSVEDKYSEETPMWGNDDIYYEKFHIVKGSIHVKGKQNNGKDWYATEKITDNWYCFEVHI